MSSCHSTCGTLLITPHISPRYAPRRAGHSIQHVTGRELAESFSRRCVQRLEGDRVPIGNSPECDMTAAGMAMLWRRIDIPGHDMAECVRTRTGWRLSGVVLLAAPAGPCRLEYRVDCTAD